MTSLSSALRIATSGINAAQTGLSTVSHNITNVNTDGYHRQSATYSSITSNGYGEGVELQNIEREVDGFLQIRITEQLADMGYTDTYLKHMEDIETLLGNPTGSTGLDKLFSNFFSELSALSNETDSSASKNNAVQKAVLVADSINNLHEDLETAQTQADDKIDQSITFINVILENINELNQEIAAQNLGSVSGSNANDLIDKRQEQLDSLAGYFAINVTETSTGAVRVTTENGRQLVDVATYSQLERTSGTPHQGIGVRRTLVNGSLSNNVLELNTSNLTTGSVKALIDVRDTVIPDLQTEMDGLATTFMDEFNRLHSQGTSFPPTNSLSSSATSAALTATGDDLIAAFPSLADDTFHISVVDSTGDTVYTTMNTGLVITGTGPVIIPGAGPYSFDDLATAINTNVDVGVTVLGAGLGITASTSLNASGNPIITMASTDANLRIVLSNVNGDALGTLGMNQFFTGTGASDIAVKSDIQDSPELFATAHMRDSDGGLSSLNNENILALAELSDNSISFVGAGGMPAVTDSITGYTNQWLANFAVDLQDSNNRNDFSISMMDEMESQNAAIVGVNIDEELTQMLIYQNAFQASARVAQTIDELLQTLINIVR